MSINFDLQIRFFRFKLQDLWHAYVEKCTIEKQSKWLKSKLGHYPLKWIIIFYLNESFVRLAGVYPEFETSTSKIHERF